MKLPPPSISPPSISTEAGAVEVVRASTHNLKEIDCRIPHGRVTVVTGPSGAGKSSLAFDTVYAEAQRRFVESMSTYTRQFLEKMERPPVEEMTGILPAIALVAHNSVKNARSTVGTLTDIHDVLRLLFTYLGEVRCPNGHGPMLGLDPERVVDRLLVDGDGKSVTVVAPIVRPTKNAEIKLRELVRAGYFRVLEGERLERLTPKARWFKKWDPLPMVLGRFRVEKEQRRRLVAAVEEAYTLTNGRVELHGTEEPFFSERLTCPRCGSSANRPVPALFSFNSPLGACPGCQGFGRVIGVDRDRVVPDPSKSLREKPIAPWNSPAYEKHYARLWPACEAAGIPLDVPWSELGDEDRRFVWSGKGSFTSLDGFFARLERRNYRMHVRVLLARYRAYEACPECGGDRLRPEALRVELDGRSIAEVSRGSLDDVRIWLRDREWSGQDLAAAEPFLEELTARLDTLCDVGLHYLSLDRQARTLSGGESQRIQLASAIGSGLTTTLYVLDEPTIGLHPKDSDRLLALLRRLASQGNTVLVVEHDRTLIRGADHVIDLGPRAGEHGGEVVAEGGLEEILASPTSLTSRYLQLSPEAIAGNGAVTGPRSADDRPSPSDMIVVRGASENNLKDLDVELPRDRLVAVTGVSGSGKSTLVQQVLYGTFQRARGVVDVDPGRCLGLDGVDDLEDIVLVDQRPLGRSSRSNPATYIKAYDEMRKLYAASERARRLGIQPAQFSFNVEGGRCPECEGTGVQEVDMHFMAAVRVGCDECQGRRFQRRVLEIRYRGLDISEALDLTIDGALEHFVEVPRLCRRLQLLVDVGLGYLRVGQSTATLSGGEAQRLKLASFLDSKRRKTQRPRLFLFDEPTTGLHMADIDLLHTTFRRLIDRGDGVVVVEHSLDLVARADWIVDLGPGGGNEGGELLFSGPMADFLERGEGPTTVELARHLELGAA